MKTRKRIRYSNKLNLDYFFYNLKDEIYVVVKLADNFPNYFEGADIDIFIYREDLFTQKFLGLANRYIREKNFKVQVKKKERFHTAVDFYYKGKLDFRFDIYSALPHYQKVNLKESYFYSVIENAYTVKRSFKNKSYSLYIPSPEDDMLLRYVEYLEWYEQREDKIKHLEFILKSLSKNARRINFIDKLHAYTELPSSTQTDNHKKRMLFSAKYLLKKTIGKSKQEIRKVIAKIKAF